MCLSLTAALAIGTLSGCGKKDKDELLSLKKEEIVAMYRDLESANNDQILRIDELETMLKGIQDEEAPTSAISVMGDGTGRLTFNSFKNQIILPAELAYPESTQISSTGSISIVENVSLSPGNNWLVKMGNSQAELEHSNGISAIFKVGSVRNLYDKNKLQEDVLSPFLKELPPDTVVYNNIFINDVMWGVQATTGTFIDSEQANLRIGVIGFAERSMVYMFCYRGEKDELKEEAITSLLNTMKFFGGDVRIGE